MTSDFDGQERTTLEHLSPVEPTGEDTGRQGMRKGSSVYSSKITIHTKYHPSMRRSMLGVRIHHQGMPSAVETL